jgi:signal transduction histidine kinase
MDTVGRTEDSLATSESPRDPPSSIPEMVRLAEAFASMRKTLATYEARLRETERVRGGQETARFVAHEIRNTLTPVRASLSVLEAQLRERNDTDRPRSERALELIRREADRMAALAGAFSEYARFPDRHPVRLDLAALVDEIARAEVPSRIELQITRPAETPNVLADRDEMERIFRNLVKNAVEAMPEKGRLLVEVRAEEGGLEIDLTDSGCGMNEETLRKVFQPGFTTKETGTGLGLALVRRALSHYGGTIRLESTLGSGTRCRVRIPTTSQKGDG